MDISKKRKREIELRRKKQRFLFCAAALVICGAAAATLHEKREKEAVSQMQIVTGEDVPSPPTSEEKQDNLLVLVNKTHPLPDNYEVNLYWLQNKSCAVSVDMYDALREMLTDGSEDGREFVVASGYRDADFQRELLEEDIAASMDQEGLSWQEAYEKETQETMPPGYSEHETGLAVDIVSFGYQVLDGKQENTNENKWLRENCSKYGFILRYPKKKEEITGISYEPWHFRFVGKEAAEEITRQGITLEEYLGEA